jgi:hypothetical protein
MARYIDADKAIFELGAEDWEIDCKYFIEEQPTADVVEAVHGEWEKDTTKVRGDGEIYDYRCSECKQPAHKGDWGNNDVFTGYCPNCGAKMDGKKVE